MFQILLSHDPPQKNHSEEPLLLTNIDYSSLSKILDWYSGSNISSKLVKSSR